MVKVKREHNESLEEQPEKKKTKKIKEDDDDDGDKSILETSGVIGELSSLPYEEKLNFVSVIAQPMVSKKVAKKLYKLIKKASKQKHHLRSGLRDVQMRIRKGETGLVVFAGDVTPIEVMCHLPAVCEDKSIPYGYVPLRADISSAMGVKRPCLMAMVRPNPEYDELYKECEAALKALPLPA